MVTGYGRDVNREVVWSPVGWPGSEHLNIRTDDAQVVADGVVLAVLDARPMRLSYKIVCDLDWRVQRLSVDLYGQPGVTLVRRADDRWYDGDGRERADLAGCVDVDIAVTPFTNTLPIRRLALAPEESADLRVVYVQVEPALNVSATDQHYLRLGADADADFRYRSGSFTADLRVDGDGLVTEYPGLWVQAR